MWYDVMTDRQRRFRTFGTPWLLRCWRSRSAEPHSRCNPTHRMEHADSIEQRHFQMLAVKLWVSQHFPTFPNKSIRFHQYWHGISSFFISSYRHADHSDSLSIDPRMFGLRTMFFVVQDLVQLFGLLKYGLRLRLELEACSNLLTTNW